LSNDAVNQTLPNFSLTPVPIDLGSSITWSPTFSFTNSQAFNQGPGVVVELP
ncbi:MAG: hypothetical protein GTN83_14830, partial [Acidobacteria bacterium]|nr:hypothetical protein [Acidobacteriota bacterium]